MHYVYALYSKYDKKFYIGQTADINRRLKEHKNGRVHTTCRYANLECIFYEAFGSKADAIRREQYFKTTQGRKALRLITRNSLENSYSLTGSVTVAQQALDLPV